MNKDDAVQAIKNKIHDEITKKYSTNHVIANKQEKIDDEVRTLLFYEGYDRCYNCKAEYNGLDISFYLDLIRSKDVENVLLLKIRNGEIGDYFIFEGKENHITAESYFENNAVDKIISWHNEGAEILNYHNHPNRIAARPSLADIHSMNQNYSNWENRLNWISAEEEYNKKLPDNFQYADWGVITEIDFFSANQMPSEIEKIVSEEMSRRKDTTD